MILPSIFAKLQRLIWQPKREKPSLLQQLEDIYYDKFPEDWPTEGPLFVIGPQYERILNGEQSYVDRAPRKEETWSNNTVKRGKRTIWQVGNIYYVAVEFIPTRDSVVKADNIISETWTVIPERKVEDALGRIQLTKIDPVACRLYFKVI